jgi:hypothetical protein
VISPADKLITSADAKRHTARFHPTAATLRKNISGSIEGDAIQNDITGANGTPLVSNVKITGMTPQEQNGLNAPTSVASRIARYGRAWRAFLICPAMPDMLMITDSKIVASKYGQNYMTLEKMMLKIDDI